MLLHSGPLGCAHHLLYVELLPFGSISSEDRELVQLKKVLESSPRVWMPSFGNFIVYSSPQVMLVYLVANTIPLGLRITGMEVPQKLVRLGDCLVVSLLGFLEHLLSLLNLHLVGLHINIRQDSSLGPNILQEILQGSGQLHYSLENLPALRVKALLADEM
jgi:hypothetical protein